MPGPANDLLEPGAPPMTPRSNLISFNVSLIAPFRVRDPCPRLESVPPPKPSLPCRCHQSSTRL